MSGAVNRVATNLRRPRRQWVRLVVIVVVLLVLAAMASILFTGLSKEVVQRVLGKFNNDTGSEFRITPPSAFEMPPPPPPPKPAATPAPSPTLAQALQANPITAHIAPSNLDAFGDMKLKLPQATNTTQAKDPPSQGDVNAVAFGGSAKGLNLPGGKATVVKDLSRTLRPGTRIPCTLQNAIDTTTGDGAITCVVSQNVMSWDGTVALMPAGTLISGTYKPLQNGRHRIFALAAYATGDDGLVVPLGDPIADAEGRMGTDGETVSNFWPRMKTALVLDLAQNLMSAIPSVAQGLAQHGNSNQYFNFSTGGMDQAITESLRRDSEIPDILKKNQGETISLLVTSPVFFQDAIRLRMRGG